MGIGKPPPGWGDDELTRFIDITRQNEWATFANLKGSFRRLRDIDDLFMRAGRNLDHNQHWFPSLFLYKSHSSYRGACRMAMSGQLSESFMVMRGCLEHALYSRFFFENPKSAEVWAKREDSEECKKAVKDMFKIGPMLNGLAAEDAGLGRTVRQLYDRTIDWGGHPNSLSLFSNLRISESEDETKFEVLYLARERDALKLALKTNAQVGVASLSIFRLIFCTRFDIAGLSGDIEKLKEGL